MHGHLGRRDFCVRACRAASVVTLSVCSGCGDANPITPSPIASAPAARPDPTPSPDPAPSLPVPPASSVSVPLPVVSATLAQRTLSIAIEDDSPLSSMWGAARTGVVVGLDPWDFLLTRTGPDTFTALFATCTHHGCLVSQFASPVFVCPCHGSRFDHNGEVVNGPASAPLRRFPTHYQDGVLRVQF